MFQKKSKRFSKATLYSGEDHNWVYQFIRPFDVSSTIPQTVTVDSYDYAWVWMRGFRDAQIEKIRNSLYEKLIILTQFCFEALHRLYNIVSAHYSMKEVEV